MLSTGFFKTPTVAPTAPVTTAPTGSDQKCGFTTCQGIDLQCGSNVAEVCTMVYLPGDRCRQFARCSNDGGTCHLVASPEFDRCKDCIKNCMRRFGNDTAGVFGCEKTC